MNVSLSIYMLYTYILLSVCVPIDINTHIYAIYITTSVNMSNFKHVYLPISRLIDTNCKIRQDVLQRALQPATIIFI